jgi:hypothetical protein
MLSLSLLAVSMFFLVGRLVLEWQGVPSPTVL